MTTPRMHPADLEALADLVAARLRPLIAEAGRDAEPDGRQPQTASSGPSASPTPGKLLTAGEAATLLGVSAAWIRQHRDELGCVPLGDGPKPRLRFERAAVLAAAQAPRSPRRTPPAPAQPVPRRRKQARPLPTPGGLARGVPRLLQVLADDADDRR